jgi:hypothetical protein
MKYLIVVYTHEDGVLGAVRAYEQDQLTPEDAVIEQGEALEAIERS